MVHSKISILDNINYFILFKFRKNYFKKAHVFFLDKLQTGNVLFFKFLMYEYRAIRKYYFLGLCIGLRKNNINSSVVIRNVLGGVLIEQKFLIFNNLLILCRHSKKRFVTLGLKKSKLFFLENMPFFFRLNKAAVLDIKFYSNLNNKRFFFFKKKKRF